MKIVIIYSHLRWSKYVLSFFHGMQKEKFWRLWRSLFSIHIEQGPNLSSFKMDIKHMNVPWKRSMQVFVSLQYKSFKTRNPWHIKIWQEKYWCSCQWISLQNVTQITLICFSIWFTDSFVAFYSSQLKERLLVNKDLKSVYFSHKMIV